MRRVWLPIAVVVIAVAAGIAAVAGRDGRPVWRLADGSTVALEAITYGKVHEVTYGRWWQKLLLLLLPPTAQQDLQRRFGCVRASYATRSPNTLVLWLSRRAGRPARDTRAVVFDERGREFEAGGRWYLAGISMNPWSTLQAMEVPAFPRRGTSVRIRLYQRVARDRWERVGECRVRNPTPGPHPVWTPRRFPVTVRDGDTAFSMTGLNAGLDAGDVPRAAGPREAEWSRATFRITRAGRPETWEPVNVTISDATGNVWTPRASFPHRTSREASLFFVGVPWPDEPAWKLRVEFARATGFAPGEVWTVRGLPVPARGRNTRSTRANQG